MVELDLSSIKHVIDRVQNYRHQGRCYYFLDIHKINRGQYEFDRLTTSDIVFYDDVVDFPQLKQFLAHHGMPEFFVLNNYLSMEHDLPVPMYCVPTQLDQGVSYFSLSKINFFDTMQTKHAFNFAINKKTALRYLCLKFVEMFELDSFDYTWSGFGQTFDCTPLLQDINRLESAGEIDQQQKSQLLAPVQLKPKFQRLGAEIHDNVNYTNPNQITVWNQLLGPMMSQTAVSLITETDCDNRGAFFSEKTQMAFAAETFPIWVGGYKQPDEFKSAGIDVFDDVIDHSYQTKETLVERCYYAFKLNVDLLKNIDLCRDLRNQHRQRLEDNRKKMASDHVYKIIYDKVKQTPLEFQAHSHYKQKLWDQYCDQSKANNQNQP